MLRAVVFDAGVKFGVVSAREWFSAGAFVAPGTVGFGSAFGPANMGAPAADGVRNK